jgi:hypothetical protein
MISLRLFEIPDGKKLLAVSLVFVLTALVFGSFLSSNFVFKAYAQPPAPGFGSGASCADSAGINFWAESCCWKEGGIVSPEYWVCQTCFTFHYPIIVQDCGPTYTPFTHPGSGPITGPLDGGVVLGSQNILPFDLRDILTMPENQTYSISVQHGPNSDTIKIEIPKALSNSILNQTIGIPKVLSNSILNQTNFNQTATK